MIQSNWDGKEKYDALLDKCVVKNGPGNICFSLAMLDDEDIRWMLEECPTWDLLDVNDSGGNNLLDIAKERGLMPLGKASNRNLYRVTTTFSGAASPSKFYFNTRKKAEEFLRKECQNGECEPVFVYGVKNYFDGCTMCDLTEGMFDADEEVGPIFID